MSTFVNNLATRAIKIHERLLEFYGEPIWRNPLPAIDELVSTILSQEVRDAEANDVVNAIRPAGLANQKGPRIQQVLRSITEERGSLDLSFLADLSVDEAKMWLTKFNGVGPKTAAIVLCFSLNKAAFPVDTHIYRVTGRIGLRPEKMTVEQAHPHLESLFPPETYYAAHLNIIRLGREICTSRKAICEKCPLLNLCDYGMKNMSLRGTA